MKKPYISGVSESEYFRSPLLYKRIGFITSDYVLDVMPDVISLLMDIIKCLTFVKT